MTIYRYEIKIEVAQEIELQLPVDAIILSVKQRHSYEHVQLWAKCYTEVPMVPRKFIMFATGRPIPKQYWHSLVHIETILDEHDEVWHIFEVITKHTPMQGK